MEEGIFEYLEKRQAQGKANEGTEWPAKLEVFFQTA